jgi:hypothetical protein
VILTTFPSVRGPERNRPEKLTAPGVNANEHAALDFANRDGTSFPVVETAVLELYGKPGQETGGARTRDAVYRDVGSVLTGIEFDLYSANLYGIAVYRTTGQSARDNRLRGYG